MTRSLLFFAIVISSSSMMVHAEEKLTPITPEDPKLGRPVDFERDLYPVLDQKCVACHNVAVDESKLVLEDVESILKGGKRGPAVVPEKPEESWMFKMAASIQGPAMPPQPNSVEAPSLTPRELGILRQWILEGAKAGSGAQKMTINWSPIPDSIQSSYSLDLSPHARKAAIGRANQIDLYDVVNPTHTARLTDPLLSQLKFDEQPLYPRGAAHQDFVHALAFHPSGNLIASSGYRVIKLWEQPQNVRNWESPALPAETTATALSTDRQSLAVGLSDGKVLLINTANGQTVREFAGLTAAVSGVAFSPDGTQLIAGSFDKKAIAWKTADGAAVGEIATPVEIEGLALNKDGNRLITGHRDNILRVWELPGVAKPKEGQQEITPLVELKGHSHPVKKVLPHPTDANQCASSSLDGTIRFWRLDNGQNLRTLTTGAPVNDFDISVDGSQAVSAGADGVARVWRTDNGQKLIEVKGHLDALNSLTIKTETASVAKQKVALADAAVKAEEKSVTERTEALKKANESLVAADKKLKEEQDKLPPLQETYDKAKAAFDAKKDDKNLEKAFKDAETALNKQKDEIKKAEESQKVASNSVKLSDQSLKKSQANLETRKQALTAAQQMQATADAETKTATDAVAASVKPLHSTGFSPNGKTFAVGDETGVLSVWNIADGSPLSRHQRTPASLKSIDWVNDSGLITSGADKQLASWNLNPTWQLIARLGPPADKPLEVADSLLEDRVVSLAFSPDGKWLASGGGEPSRNGELIIWDVAQRKLHKKLEDAHSDTVLGVDFSHDSQFLVSGSADKFAKMFSVPSGEFVRAFEGHTHHVMDVSIKKDNSEIATAGADNAIKIWNAETGEQKRTISNYSKQVTSIQYQGDQDIILSCGGDKTVRLHRSSNGSNFRNFGGAVEYQYRAAISRDGKLVMSSGEDGILLIWNGTNGQSIAQLQPPQPAETQTVSTGQ